MVGFKYVIFKETPEIVKIQRANKKILCSITIGVISTSPKATMSIGNKTYKISTILHRT